MKNLLNLKRTVWKQSITTQLRRSNDGQTTVERRSRLMSIICLFLLLTLGTGQMCGYTATFYCVPKAIWGNDWDDSKTVKIAFRVNNDNDSWAGGWWSNMELSNTGKKYNGNYIYSLTKNDLPADGVKYVHFYRFNGNSQEADKSAYNAWADCNYWNNHMLADSWKDLTYDDRVSGGNVYFDVQNSGWDVNDVQFVIGHGAYSVFYNTSPVSNTQLYYISAADWTDAWYFAFANLCSTWTSGEANSYDNRKTSITGKYTEKKTDFNLSSGNYYVFNAASSTNNAAVNSDSPAGYKGSVASSLNSTQTIKYAVSENGRTPTLLTSGTVPATISMSSYKFVNGTNNSVSTSTASNTLTAGGSNFSATIQAAYTGTTVLTMSSLNSDYAFLGWYDAVSGGNQLESGDTYTYYPRTSTTVYARFSHEINHEVTISRYCTSTSIQINSTTAKVGEVTYSEITAPVIDGYNFTGWELGTGVSLKDGDNTSSATIHVKTLSSGAHTMQANYTEVLTTTWKIIGASDSGSPFSNWTYSSSTDAMSKKSGHSAENKAYKTFNVTTVPSGTNYYAFKVAESSSVNYGYGTNGDDHILFDRTKTDQSIYTNSNTDHNLRFKPDALGEYEFKIDYTSGKQLSVTFPTAYTVTFSKGAVDGADGSVTAEYSDVAFSSGTKVQSGKSVTFKAPNAKTGYTFQGWYTVNNGSGTTNRESDSQNYTTTITATKTLYACYTENIHTVTVSAGANGRVSASSVNAYRDTKSEEITATPNAGYVFQNWTIPSGVTLAEGYTVTSNPIKIHATEDEKTVTANFFVKYALYGSIDATKNPLGGMPGWSTAQDFTYDAGTSTYTTTVTLTVPNTTYKFRILDHDGNTSYGLSSEAVIPADNNFHPVASTAADAQLATAGVGTYTLTVQTIADGGNAGKPQVKITNPASHRITMDVKTDFGASDAAGGSISAVDGETTPNVITNGKYIKDGGTIVVTATPSTGYSLAGWYSDAECTAPYTAGGNVAIDDEARTLTLSSLNANKTIYAKFTENRTTVTVEANNAHGTVTIAAGAGRTDETHASVGVYTTASVTAEPDAGYYFAGWTLSNETFTASGTAEANTTITITGAGTAGTSGTLTANFVELDKIYFRNWNEDANAALWENVYVYFGISWSGDNRPIASNTASNIVQMEQIGTSNIYWAYVPRAEYTNSKIAFSNHQFTTGYTFYQYESVKWGSYNRKLNMCVPKHGDTETIDNTLFYKSYWKNYGLAAGSEAGYYMKRLNSSSNGYEDAATDCKFVVVDENTISYKLRVDNMGTDYHNKYMVHSAGAIKYVTHSVSGSEGTAITTDACTDVNMTQYDDGTPRFLITPSSEGDYTITIDQSGDVMKISVDYPVSVGDYLLVHNYNNGTAKMSHSDIIKKGTATSTVSMYLNMDAGTKSLTLKKCTSTAGGTPTFGEEHAVGISLFNTTTFDKGNGVYKFDITISGDEVTAIASDGLYTGKYYIKTDYAPGGWVNFKQNVLEQNTINFSKSDANTYDYYHCAWVDGDGKNVKCIIANDYNEQLTDTLIGDDILGDMGDDAKTPRQYLATAANVRFSYNSYTDELKRTYINGASGWEASFLSLKDMYTDGTHGGSSGTKTITKTDGSALTNDTISFRDKGNWIYQIDVKAGANSYIWLSANYKFNSTNHMQDLIGTSTAGDLLIGSGLETPQRMTLIYDFKTNNLIAAWTPAETYGTEIDLNSDVLLIHNRMEDGTDEVNIIDLTEGGKIKNINRVYSALRFQKTTADGIIGLSGNYASTAESYYRYNYLISFPYDVKMTDIFGVADYGSKWRIQYYDGAERASKGWYLGDGTTTFWKTMPMNEGSVLHKGEGYVLQLSPSAFKATGSGSLWALVDEIYLYFPSQARFGHIGLNTSSVTLSPLPCTKGLYTDGSGKDHNLTDSHWHVFGIPTFKEATGTTGTGDNYYDSGSDGDQEAHAISGGEFYFYEYNNDGITYNTYTVTGSSGYTFQPMHAYMIQMTGTLNFAINSVPASVAARQKKEIQNYDLRLELASEGQVADQTFVTLRENAVADFALNEDLTKIHNTGKANIYSYAGVYDVAANILPVENRTVVLGVETAKAGTYTFSMPSNFDGIVTLIDNFTQTRTNLAIEDYEVSLPKGEINDRFLLEINIRQVPTAIDGVEGGSLKDGKAHKFIENGVMYILREGQIYDARGNKVK